MDEFDGEISMGEVAGTALGVAKGVLEPISCLAELRQAGSPEALELYAAFIDVTANLEPHLDVLRDSPQLDASQVWSNLFRVHWSSIPRRLVDASTDYFNSESARSEQRIVATQKDILCVADWIGDLVTRFDCAATDYGDTAVLTHLLLEFEAVVYQMVDVAHRFVADDRCESSRRQTAAHKSLRTKFEEVSKRVERWQQKASRCELIISRLNDGPPLPKDVRQLEELIGGLAADGVQLPPDNDALAHDTLYQYWGKCEKLDVRRWSIGQQLQGAIRHSGVAPANQGMGATDRKPPPASTPGSYMKVMISADDYISEYSVQVKNSIAAAVEVAEPAFKVVGYSRNEVDACVGWLSDQGQGLVKVMTSSPRDYNLLAERATRIDEEVVKWVTALNNSIAWLKATDPGRPALLAAVHAFQGLSGCLIEARTRAISAATGDAVPRTVDEDQAAAERRGYLRVNLGPGS